MIYVYKRKKHLQTIEGRIPDELWDEFKIMIPTKRPNNTRGHPIVPFRKVLDGIILYVLSIPVSVVVITPAKQQNLCLDKGYDYLEIEIEPIKRRYIPHIRHRGENKELIKHDKYYYSKRRWVVIEMTNSWNNRCKKLLVRYEKKSENYLALVYLACCIIVYRRIVLG